MVVIDWELKWGEKRFVEPIKERLQSVECVCVHVCLSESGGAGPCWIDGNVLHNRTCLGPVSRG